MPVFEICDEGVVYTNGAIGALLQDCGSCGWLPYRYFCTGELDIEYDNYFENALDAFERAKDYYS